MNLDADQILALVVIAILGVWLLWRDIVPRAIRNARYRAGRRAAMLRHPAGKGLTSL